MTEVRPITDRATHKVALARLMEVFHASPDTPEEREGNALAEAVHHYEQANFSLRFIPTDGVHHIEYLLDQEIADLPGLLEIFGGRKPFMEFMLRAQPLDDSTIDAIVTRFNAKRKRLDRPFCEPPGWDSIMDGEWLEDALDKLETVGVPEPAVALKPEPMLTAVAAGG